ncbi:type II toxin-antitoxin system HicB family antitoxin [Flavobacterium plurextorum]|uniref:type II toxin-antitoxin system HicB family antitoxin n=1 Tax=Flavobacterium plurextorum TaxID=1114867 RepID=UPI003758466A
MTIKVEVKRYEKHGIYLGTTQNLPGVVISEGSTLDELRVNLEYAIESYIEVTKLNEHEKEIALKLMKGFGFEFDVK